MLRYDLAGDIVAALQPLDDGDEMLACLGIAARLKDLDSALSVEDDDCGLILNVKRLVAESFWPARFDGSARGGFRRTRHQES